MSRISPLQGESHADVFFSRSRQKFGLGLAQLYWATVFFRIFTTLAVLLLENLFIQLQGFKNRFYRVLLGFIRFY